MIIVRSLSSSDIDTVVDVIYQAITVTNAPDYHPDVISQQASYFSRGWVEKRKQSRFMVVALIDEVLVGTGSFEKGEIKSIYVRPSSTRQGVGRAIMKFLEGHAFSEGYSSVHLGSSKTAVAFYEKLKYHLDETVPFVSAGHTILGYQMSKSLS